jgi:nucleoid DNA-binding protein
MSSKSKKTNQIKGRRRVTRKTLARNLMNTMGFTQAKAERCVHNITQLIMLSVMNGDIVELANLGRIYGVVVEERPGTNPRTQEKITISKRVRLTIDASSPFKRKLIEQVGHIEQVIKECQSELEKDIEEGVS